MKTLDHTDFKILNSLQEDSTLSVKDLAEKIGLSFTAQLCGQGIDCGLDAFKDLLSGNTSCPENLPGCYLQVPQAIV